MNSNLISREDTFSRSPVDYSEINIVFVCAYGVAFSMRYGKATNGIEIHYVI